MTDLDRHCLPEEDKEEVEIRFYVGGFDQYRDAQKFMATLRESGFSTGESMYPQMVYFYATLSDKEDVIQPIADKSGLYIQGNR